MRVLVVGAGGLVGSNVVTAALDREWSVEGTYHTDVPAPDVPLSKLDLRETDQFRPLVRRTDPDAVVLCAAMTDVDDCERRPELAHAVNGEAPGSLAAVCQEAGVPFVHLSTDYVFDGRTGTPYDESAAANPLQEYGRSKLAGERAVERSHDAPLVLRLSFVYGIDRSESAGTLTGFPAWVRNRLRAGESVPLFTDQRVTPSRAEQVAETVLDLLAERATGTYHVACRSCVSPYEFGVAVARRMDVPETRLGRSVTADLDRPAERPRGTCLDVERVETRLGRDQPTLADDLDAVEGWLTDAAE